MHDWMGGADWLLPALCMWQLCKLRKLSMVFQPVSTTRELPSKGNSQDSLCLSPCNFYCQMWFLQCWKSEVGFNGKIWFCEASHKYNEMWISNILCCLSLMLCLIHFSNLHLWGSFTAKWKVFFSRNVRFLSKTGWLFLKKLKAFCKEHCVNMYISFHNVPGGS